MCHAVKTKSNEVSVDYTFYLPNVALLPLMITNLCEPGGILLKRDPVFVGAFLFFYSFSDCPRVFL